MHLSTSHRTFTACDVFQTLKPLFFLSEQWCERAHRESSSLIGFRHFLLPPSYFNIEDCSLLADLLPWHTCRQSHALVTTKGKSWLSKRHPSGWTPSSPFVRRYGGGSRTKGIEYARRHNSTFSNAVLEVCNYADVTQSMCVLHLLRIQYLWIFSLSLCFFFSFFFFLPKEVLMSVSEHSSGVPVMYIIHYRHCCVQKHFNRAVVLSSLLKTTALLKWQYVTTTPLDKGSQRETVAGVDRLI